MCFAFDALPPDVPADLVLPRLAGGAAAEMRELVAADGTRLSAAIARAPEPGAAAVVIIPDVRGLYRFYIELAERFASTGHDAIVIDPFGRTAGTGERDASFDFLPHVEQTRPALVQQDVAAALAALRQRDPSVPCVVVGFCFGGGQAFLAATNPDLDLAAVVGFYGRLAPREPGRGVAAMDEAVHTRTRVLALFGGGDEHIPADQRETFAANLERSGAEHEIVVYPGAPHSFFDRRQEENAEASADAWRRILGLLDEVGAPTTA